MHDHYDLCVIGSGPAGEKGAAQAAYFGKRVCLIERAPKPGGAAVNTGAIPARTLRETALYFSGLRRHGLYGVEYRVKPDITIGDFMHRERAVVDASWRMIARNLDEHGVAQLQGEARFVDAGTVEVTRHGEEARTVSADVFLLATGSRTGRRPGVPYDGRTVVGTEEVLSIPAVPSRLVVVGADEAGCEYAATFAALGARVTLICEEPRLLPSLDADVADALRGELTRRLGIQVLLDVPLRAVRTDGDRAVVALADGRELVAECVLAGGAREGGTAGLGLAAADVLLDPHGFVRVDDDFRTSNPRIFAAGDVTGRAPHAGAAMEQGRVAMCHAFDLRYKTRVADVIPGGVWTIPEVATVGLGEEEAGARGITVETGRASFRTNAHGQIVGETEGFVKLVFRTDDKRLVGASILGDGACELVHLPAAVLHFEGTLDYFIDAVFNFPTFGEAFKYAAYDGLQRLQRRVSKAMEARSRAGRVSDPGSGTA